MLHIGSWEFRRWLKFELLGFALISVRTPSLWGAATPYCRGFRACALLKRSLRRRQSGPLACHHVGLPGVDDAAAGEFDGLAAGICGHTHPHPRLPWPLHCRAPLWPRPQQIRTAADVSGGTRVPGRGQGLRPGWARQGLGLGCLTARGGAAPTQQTDPWEVNGRIEEGIGGGRKRTLACIRDSSSGALPSPQIRFL